MKLSSKQVGIALTALITAILHFAAAWDRVLFPDGIDPLFTLNGIGYIGLLGAYLLPIPFFQQRHKWVRWALIGFAIITILAWIFIVLIMQNPPLMSRDSYYGVPAKIAEVILISLLWSDRD